jgi:hypothetical protein
MCRDEHEERRVVQVAIYCRIGNTAPADGRFPELVLTKAARGWCQTYLAGRPHEVELFADEGYCGNTGWQPRGAKGKLRPELARLVDSLRAGDVDVLIIYSLSSLFRSARLWDQFVTEVLGPSGALVVSISEGLDATSAELVAQVEAQRAFVIPLLNAVARSLRRHGPTKRK